MKTDAIFLSASVPDPRRAPEYAKTADTVAITAAVSALIHVTLGRRLLVWGGHPAITPMIWVVAEALGADYGQWVRLYQSAFFKDEFPEDNARFNNVTYTQNVEGSLEKSLVLMRERMFSEFNITDAIFIGGMGGIIDEYHLLKKMQPAAKFLPIVSTGGATEDVAKNMTSVPQDLNNDMDYVSLFHRNLGISVKEIRYKQLDMQPKGLEDRFWGNSRH